MLHIEQMVDKLKYVKPRCGFSPALSRLGPQSSQSQVAQDDKLHFVTYLPSPYPL